jgi:hypothetical protein
VGKEIVFVTTQVVSLKVFRLKANVIKRAIMAHLVEATTASRHSHGLTIRPIHVFPNSLQPKIYPPDQIFFKYSHGEEKARGKRKKGGNGEAEKRGKGERERGQSSVSSKQRERKEGGRDKVQGVGREGMKS